MSERSISVRRRSATAVTCVLAAHVWAGLQVSAAVPAMVAEVSIPNTRRMEFVSNVNGHRYAINVALPMESPPQKGYHVLYVLDGDWYFASAVEAVRMLDLAKAPGTVVVGIGYPSDSAYYQSVLTRRGPVPSSLTHLPASQAALLLERTYDLTLPASNEVLAVQSPTGTPEQKSENVGGLNNFLKVIETEVKPRVAAFIPVDAGSQSLFGHSFGGLAALHALFVEPTAFQAFIISSPSIWWSNKEVLLDEKRFSDAVVSGSIHARVLVTVGGRENAPIVAKSWRAQARMVEDGRELVSRLKALRGSPDFVIEDYAVFDKEDHVSAPWSALARGIPFSFGADCKP